MCINKQSNYWITHTFKAEKLGMQRISDIINAQCATINFKYDK